MVLKRLWLLKNYVIYYLFKDFDRKLDKRKIGNLFLKGWNKKRGLNYIFGQISKGKLFYYKIWVKKN